MHKEQAGLFGKHVTVHRRDRGTASAQLGEHGIYFSGNQDEVARFGDSAGTSILRVDGFGYAGCWRDGHSVHDDRIALAGCDGRQKARNGQDEQASFREHVFPDLAYRR
jgi:hypothetical protein